jgi:hypothetical protein
MQQACAFASAQPLFRREAKPASKLKPPAPVVLPVLAPKFSVGMARGLLPRMPLSSRQATPMPQTHPPCHGHAEP